MSDQPVSKDTVFNVLATEAGGYYKSILTVASSFLGGSLIFIEKIAPTPSKCSLYLLGVGWLLLICSIATIIFVRRLNLDSGWKALEGNFNEAKEIDVKTRNYSTAATVLLFLGLILIMMFGFVNLLQKTAN